MTDISAIRRTAWETRRAKYGPKGHAGRYGRARPNRLLDLVIRLHVEGVLSEGQVAAAAGIDRVSVRRLADASKP